MKKAMLSGLIGVAAAAAALAAGLEKQSVTMATADGVTISGYFVKGKADKGPAVVLVHMYARSKEDWDPIIEKYLMPQTGMSFLAIDLRGHGESTKQGDKTLSYKDFSDADFKNMTKDIEAAVKWLREKSEVDGDKIAIVGASIGANVALNYAAGDPKIKAVALLSPAEDYRGVKTLDAMTKYGDRPVFISVSREDLQSSRDFTALWNRAKGKKVKAIFDGNLHGTRMFGNVPLDEPLADFLKENLK